MMWDWSVRLLDWLVIAPALLLACLTLWTASYPIVDTAAWWEGVLAWALVASGWSARLLATVRDGISRNAAQVLLVGSVVSIPIFTVGFMFLALAGTVGLVIPVLVGVGIFLVIVANSRPRRLAWFVVPAITLVMLGILATGLPRLVRMATAEPELTAFAQSVTSGGHGQLPTDFDHGLSVGTIPIYGAYDDWGGLHLVTGYVGVLNDDEAGLAYFPGGPPANDFRYEHLLGAWYRWFPY